MIAFLQTALSLIVVLGVLVFVHELGHFVVAKRLGIGIPVFSLGIGPRLFGFRRGGTDYRVSAFPLGGYVRLAGEHQEDERTGGPEEFLSRPRWQRFLVYVAGAALNLVFAFLALWFAFAVFGKWELTGDQVVTAVSPGSPAEAAGVRPGDRVVQIAGRNLGRPEDFIEVYQYEILLSPNSTKRITVQRGSERVELQMGTGADPKGGHGSPGWVLGWQASEPPTVQDVAADSPAEQAGIQRGDRIVAAEGREGIGQLELRAILEASAGSAVDLEIERQGKTMVVPVVPRSENGKGRIGVAFAVGEGTRRHLGVLGSAAASLRENTANSVMLFAILKRLVTGQVPAKALSGPIGIGVAARDAMSRGFESALAFLAFISLQLGILNLLPIPVLDGGHIFLLGIESILRRDLSMKLKERVIQVGFALLLVLFAFVLFWDIDKIGVFDRVRSLFAR